MIMVRGAGAGRKGPCCHALGARASASVSSGIFSPFGATDTSVFSGSSVFILIFLYLFIPVPAGINLPMITFSFNPINSSVLPFIAASVNTLVVSWNDAADKKLSVASEAFVIPSKTLLPVAGRFP